MSRVWVGIKGISGGEIRKYYLIALTRQITLTYKPIRFRAGCVDIFKVSHINQHRLSQMCLNCAAK